MKKLNRAISAALLIVLAACSMPNSSPESRKDNSENLLVVKSDNTIMWNGDAITLAELKDELEQAAEMVPEPPLRFEPEPNASYETSADVLGVIKNSGVTKFGFVGNERYRRVSEEQTQD